MVRIGQAVMLHRAGDREEARNRLVQLWRETGSGALLHRCTIAHYLAGTQDDPRAELEWDRRALAAAEALSAERAAQGGRAGELRTLYPSLHLRLAADHWALGEVTAAHRELARARALLGGLPHDAYGTGVRAAVLRLAERLGPVGEGPAPGPPPGPPPQGGRSG
ncbi:hypothetical protein E0L36_09345 [Streptomyces sp. AJS327]|nr:hypothetical protein [Streptomyces sp. AJS327]